MSKKEEKLSSQQVSQTLEFLDYFESYNKGYNYSNFYGAGYGYYTPDIINQALQSVNTNLKVPTAEEINNALANPKNSEKILREYGTYFKLNNMYYKRLIDYNTNLPAWNLTFDFPNVSDEDLTSKEFKEDLSQIDNFISKFNSKQEFRNIMQQFIEQGIYYGVLRDEGSTYSFQQLSNDFCKITGRSTIGNLFAFDFAYFINTNGTNIDMFPKIFKKLLKKVYTQNSKEYNPAGNILKRHSSFNYWIDVSPSDNFFCFSLNETIATITPYYSALFPDMLIHPIMRDLEKNKAMVAAHKLLVGILDTYEKSKNNTVNNQFTLNPNDIGKFLAVARGALDKSIGLAMLPVKNAQVVDFTVEAQNRYATYQEGIASTSTASSASLLAQEKLNAFESELALTIDSNFVKSFYFQFENFLNFYINKNMSKYRFKFYFNDVNTKSDKDSRIELFKTTASMGLVDMNLYARAMDMDIFRATRGLKLAKIFGVEKDLTVLQSLTNQSANNEQGRPTEDSSTNDNTIASKEAGSNELK